MYGFKDAIFYIVVYFVLHYKTYTVMRDCPEYMFWKSAIYLLPNRERYFIDWHNHFNRGFSLNLVCSVVISIILFVVVF